MKARPKTHQQRRATAGFSLIELIGVMAVMAILASAILPSVIKRIQIEAAENESAFLDKIGDALIDHLRRSKEIPDQGEWAQVVAAELEVQPEEILESHQQSRRLYVIDPTLRVGTASGTLPFAQNTAGSVEPVSPRVMILSSMDGTKPIPLDSGVIGEDEFDTLWDLPIGGVPPDWSDQWQKNAEDLKVRRINFAPLFHKVMLNNYDSVDPGTYSIDGGAVQLVPYEGITAFFADGTMLGLHDSAGILETHQILHRSVAFTFERGTWRGQVHLGLKLAGDDIYDATTLFANSAQNTLAQAGATPSLVIDRFTDYMNRYVEWDAASFPGDGSQSYNAVLAAQAALGDFTGTLLYSPDPGNPTPTVTIVLDRIEDKKIKWKLTNSSDVDATIDALTLSWPGSEDLKKIKFDGTDILTNYFQTSQVTILASEWLVGKDRTLGAGDSGKILEFEFTDDFPLKKDQPASDFALEVTFEQGGSVAF